MGNILQGLKDFLGAYVSPQMYQNMPIDRGENVNKLAQIGYISAIQQRIAELL